MSRRQEVLKLVGEGKTHKAISELLGITPGGVRYHANPQRRAKNMKHTAEHRRRTKLRSLEYKGGHCSKCHYDKCIGALVFHHVDPTQKEFNFSSGHTWSWAKIQKELDKTVLLCNRCHSELHAGLWAL